MKTVIINSDASIGYLEEYKGHVLLNLREMDAGTAVKPEKQAYKLEFSDEPAQTSLTADEINTLMECAIKVANGQSIDVYQEFHMMLTDRVFRNTYSRGPQA